MFTVLHQPSTSGQFLVQMNGEAAPEALTLLTIALHSKLPSILPTLLLKSFSHINYNIKCKQAHVITTPKRYSVGPVKLNNNGR